jgi:hypothetical protein
MQVVLDFLEHCASVDSADNKGWTPLKQHL